MRVRVLLPFVYVAFFVTSAIAADKVTPSDRVTSRLRVRESASAASAVVGELRVGETADLVTSVPNWHKVRLADGTEGFVSKAFARVIPDPSEPAFQVHFLDVGTGDSAIIDIGDKEIAIDGGLSTKLLHDYAATTGIIDGPIELLVVTHGDSDHWSGLPRLLGFTAGPTTPHNVLEFWEPGYDRACNPLASYDDFISRVRNIPGIRFLRPLQQTHRPAVTSGTLETIALTSIPGIKIQVLHTDSNPTSSNGDCPYIINNASIVLKIEIAGFKFLFTGDANGKERNELSAGTPGHVEAKLLAFEATHPGTLKSVPGGCWDLTSRMKCGLCNCSYKSPELDQLRAWKDKLNAHGLFSEIDDAIAFVDVTNGRVKEHAPFYVYGLFTQIKS